MALAKVFSAVNIGLDSKLIEVEVDLGSGFPCFNIVGLPDKAVEEAKERVRSALVNSGFKFPGKGRLIINLAPADIKKEGPVYDLPIALGVLAASKQIPTNLLPLEKSLFIGELSLNGGLRRTKGILPMAVLAAQKEIKNFFLPETNATEASLVTGLKIFPLQSLNQLIGHFSGRPSVRAFESQGIEIIPQEEFEFDFAYVKGQENVKRALEIAAAGGHNLLMVGPPGAGKTLLARTLPSILPLMTREEMLEVTKIYSVAGLLQEDQTFVSQRPFRSPHHTISDIALVGGGQYPKPGEISLAHRGVLFLDEFSEFSRSVLESLRQPLEDGMITVSRARGHLTYPSKFTLIASQNPCPCGYYGDPQKQCTCPPSQILKYRKKISGPLLDRIDLHLEVPRVKFEKLSEEKTAESSKEIRARVQKARSTQEKRYDGLKILTNAELSVSLLKKFCQIDSASQELLGKAIENYQLSARAYHRILKVARTIADLTGEEKIQPNHLAEALQYRVKINDGLNQISFF